ncbi:MAG: Uma2 family endonuclease [Candidatus Tyrphobacter sp.]
MRISRENPGWKVELVDGDIQMTPPAGFRGSRHNSRITALLDAWGEQHNYAVTDSSGGYKLPGGSVLSPDAGLVLSERLANLTSEQQDEFCTLVPDVVIELASPSDSRATLRRKCERWHREGVGYVVLLDPDREPESWGQAPRDFLSLASFVEAIGSN